jgi:hypothetical protein
VVAQGAWRPVVRQRSIRGSGSDLPLRATRVRPGNRSLTSPRGGELDPKPGLDPPPAKREETEKGIGPVGGLQLCVRRAASRRRGTPRHVRDHDDVRGERTTDAARAPRKPTGRQRVWLSRSGRNGGAPRGCWTRQPRPSDVSPKPRHCGDVAGNLAPASARSGPTTAYIGPRGSPLSRVSAHPRR